MESGTTRFSRALQQCHSSQWNNSCAGPNGASPQPDQRACGTRWQALVGSGRGSDDGFTSRQDPGRLQEFCDRLTPTKVDALLRKCLGRLPHPLTREDRAAGCRYDISVRQARGQPHPDAGPAAVGPGAVRGCDPGEPRSGPAGQGRAGLPPADPPAWEAPGAGSLAHRGSHPEPGGRMTGAPRTREDGRLPRPGDRPEGSRR